MAKIEKVGVAWDRKFKKDKTGIKISINKEIYIAYRNNQKKKDTDPDYVVVRFIDEPIKDEKK